MRNVNRYHFFRTRSVPGPLLARACRLAEESGGRVLSVFDSSFFCEVDAAVVARVAKALPGWDHALDSRPKDGAYRRFETEVDFPR